MNFGVSLLVSRFWGQVLGGLDFVTWNWGLVFRVGTLGPGFEGQDFEVGFGVSILGSGFWGLDFGVTQR